VLDKENFVGNIKQVWYKLKYYLFNTYSIQYFFQYVFANLGLTFCERIFQNKVGHTA